MDTIKALRTPELHLASALLALKETFHAVEPNSGNPNRKVFVFVNSPRAEKIVRDFTNGILEVNLRDYLEALKRCRRLIDY